MSAFICTQDTLKAIAIWASDKGDDIPSLCKTLYEWNALSVAYRYREQPEKAPPFNVSDREKMKAQLLPATTIIKLCQCLEYQACEPEGYEMHPGYKITSKAMSRAIYKLKGYDEAPWGLRHGALAA